MNAKSSRTGLWPVRLLWLAVAGSYALILACSIWDVGYDAELSLPVTAYWLFFMARAVSFYIGLVFYPMCLLAMLLRRWRLSLATGLLVGLHLSWWLPLYVPGEVRPIRGQSVKIMSFNLNAGNRRIQPVLRQVLAEDPDILLLQEYAPQWGVAFRKALADRYEYKIERESVRSDGMAIFSKVPLLKARYLNAFAWSQTQTRVEIEIDGRPVALYHVHLMPPHKRKFTLAGRKMFRTTMQAIAQEKLPTILAGDFNFTEMAVYHDRLLELGFADPNDKAGGGRLVTWPAVGRYKGWFGVSIDRFYLKGPLTAENVRAGVATSSDHYPIRATIGFAE